MRNKRIGHNVHADGGQIIKLNIAVGSGGPTTVYLDLGFDTYEPAFLADFKRLTQALRGVVGKRIDQLRGDLLLIAQADKAQVEAAASGNNAWRPK